MTRTTVRARRYGGRATTAITWFISLLYFVPIAWMVATSLKPEVLAVTDPPTFVYTPNFDNYLEVLENSQFTAALANSSIATLAATILAITLAFPIAYGITIGRSRRSNDILFFLISTRMLPVAGTIVPLYLVVKNVGLLDNLLTLVILYCAMNIPLAVWLLRAYLLKLPVEVIEAAAVDGATSIQTVFRVIIPMLRPSIAAVAVLCAVFSWSEFFLAVSLTSYDAATLPVFMTSFISDRGLYWGKLCSIATLSALPMFVLGWLAQRPLMQGFSMQVDK